MKILSKRIENKQAFLTIELEPAEVEESLDRSYNQLVKETDIPGFRKGKAPRPVLEQHIGKEALLNNALDSLLPKVCAQAIEEQKIEFIARPVIKVTQKEPVVFEATVPLPPTVKLTDYYKIKMKPEPVRLKKDDVSDAIEQLRHQRATWAPVDRPVKVDDLVVLDVENSVGEKTIINEKGANYQVISGITWPAPGFSEQLLGMTRDEKKEFRLKLSKNYHERELAEKEALFKVKVIEVKGERLPELNDDFAKSVAPNIESFSSLKEQVANDLKKSAENKARIDFEQQVCNTVIKKSEVEFPPILVDIEVDRMVSQQLERLAMNARSRDEYIKRLESMPEGELRTKYRPLAVDRVIGSLVLGKIAEEEKIEVSDAEIDAEIERMTKNTGDRQEEQKKFLNTPQNRGPIRRMLITQKTVQQLAKIAEGSIKKNKTKKEVK
jgi:trigger factor